MQLCSRSYADSRCTERHRDATPPDITKPPQKGDWTARSHQPDLNLRQTTRRATWPKRAESAGGASLLSSTGFSSRHDSPVVREHKAIGGGHSDSRPDCRRAVFPMREPKHVINCESCANFGRRGRVRI